MSECVGRECCPYGLDEKFLDKIKDSAYEQGKADGKAEEREKVIDECINLSKNMGKNTYFTNDWLRYFINKLEQLKEKNETEG